ncbi:S-adenosyl-L-methionine-dependent methyltransferase [Mycena maculata]|uniref:S-adenosyl-L-methionine-dependent methyltransferase n=1 Tax=Mycena maculata TaxID=230809 RepID=A0AAD7JL10_9AGAR|nr:S-adenosyl-L-methionine-dependent methyltransferase [Mycena maculata]
MATFAKSTFNAARYAASRPTYPRSLFDTIFIYHEKSLAMDGTSAGWHHALDLGCGTGQATAELLIKSPEEPGVEPDSAQTLGFARVTGVDPSEKMISSARAYASVLGDRSSALDFVHSAAEDLKFVEDGSVDMVVAAQAAHWFEWDRLWPELSRVLKHGGTVAFWVYSEFRLPQYPQLTHLITEYAQGKDPMTSLGPHWEPGRRILTNHLLDIAPPPTGWDDVERVFFTGDYYPSLPHPHLEPIMRKTMTWGGAGLHGYLKSFSSLHRYHETFPEDLERSDGDIATRFLRTLMETAQVPLGEEGENQEVEVEWPMALVLVRKELDPSDPWKIRHDEFQARLTEFKRSYDAEAASEPDPTDVHQTRKKLDKWIAAQAKVVEMLDEDLDNIPIEVDENQVEIENQLEITENQVEVNEDRVEIDENQVEQVDEEYEDDREEGMNRYVENMESIKETVTWHLTFKRGLDTALELAMATEAEIGRENRDAGIDRWMELMQAKMEELTPVNMEELGPMPMPGGDEKPTDEQIAGMENLIETLTEEQLDDMEQVEAMTGIIAIVTEMINAVENEPISDIVRDLYISAATEVTREIAIE